VITGILIGIGGTLFVQAVGVVIGLFMGCYMVHELEKECAQECGDDLECQPVTRKEVEDHE